MPIEVTNQGQFYKLYLEVTMQMAESHGKGEIRLRVSGFKGLILTRGPTQAAQIIEVCVRTACLNFKWI